MITRFEVFIREDLIDAAGEGFIKDIGGNHEIQKFNIEKYFQK